MIKHKYPNKVHVLGLTIRTKFDNYEGTSRSNDAKFLLDNMIPGVRQCLFFRNLLKLTLTNIKLIILMGSTRGVKIIFK